MLLKEDHRLLRPYKVYVVEQRQEQLFEKIRWLKQTIGPTDDKWHVLHGIVHQDQQYFFKHDADRMLFILRFSNET